MNDKQDEIVSLTNKIKEIVDTSLREKYFSSNELEYVQSQMVILVKQSVFWMEQQNQSRFVYDLNTFLKWLIALVEKKEGEKFGE